jgi:hypothetical protein
MKVGERSSAKGGSTAGYMDFTEGSRDMLGFPVGYMNVTEGSRAKPGCLVRGVHVPLRSP